MGPLQEFFNHLVEGKEISNRLLEERTALSYALPDEFLFDDYLRLPNPTESLEHDLTDGRPMILYIWGKPLIKLVEQFITPCKKRIAQVGYIPGAGGCWRR